MESLKDLRIKLGLTQQQIADYLGIKRTTVSMVESGKRSLPAKAVIKLAELMELLPKKNKKVKQSELVKQILERQKETARKSLLAHSVKCLERVKRLEKKLEKLKVKFDKAQTQLSSIPGEVSTDEKKEKLMFDIMLIEANNRMREASQIALIDIELKISSLKFQAAKALEMSQNIE